MEDPAPYGEKKEEVKQNKVPVQPLAPKPVKVEEQPTSPKSPTDEEEDETPIINPT